MSAVRTMNFRLVADDFASAALIAIQGVVDVHDRAAFATRKSASSIPDLDRRGGYIPAAGDFGLTAREVGLWGRLRANGLSPDDAADVVKAARGEGRS